jgi:hypothetical protein
MGRTALLACPEGGTSLSAMAGLDRSSFNTEPGLRSISFSAFSDFCAVCCYAGSFFCCNKKGNVLALSVIATRCQLSQRESLWRNRILLRFDRILFRHAKASPFGRGGCEHSEQTERASPLTEMPLRDILKYKKEPLRKTMCNGSFYKQTSLIPRCRQGWRPARWRRRCTASLRPAPPAAAWAG